MTAPLTQLTRRTCVVTGASSGLGAAVAAALAAAGASVVGVARRFPAGPLPRPLPAGAVTTAALDVTDEDAVVRRFAELPALDVLVNCAGVGVFAPARDLRLADLRAMLDVHIAGAFLCARELLRRPGDGRTRAIVNVSSIAAFRTFTGCAGYSAAKEGLRGLTRVLVEEARAADVRVTGLYPGAVDTPIWDGRAGFDRSLMLRAADVAGLVVEIVVRPELAVEELVVMPPAGAL
jgi:NAD(P)-dependent dehydrogenase (short-subunit alcohol dehydrogenase family)